MTTVTTDEAVKTLPELIERSRSEKVAIRNQNGDLTYLISSAEVERERLAKVEAFEKLCKETSAHLEKQLAAEGLSPEEFLADILKDI